MCHIGRSKAVNRKRMQVSYGGQVQGVGFRYSVKSVASGFEVTGTVRNLPDGRVELVAEGTPDELEAFRQAIRESGLGHFIKKEDVSWGEVTNGVRGFEIVR
jgi:acylphosphatase